MAFPARRQCRNIVSLRPLCYMIISPNNAAHSFISHRPEHYASSNPSSAVNSIYTEFEKRPHSIANFLRVYLLYVLLLQTWQRHRPHCFVVGVRAEENGAAAVGQIGRIAHPRRRHGPRSVKSACIASLYTRNMAGCQRLA